MARQSLAEWCRPRYKSIGIFLLTQAVNIVHAWENVRASGGRGVATRRKDSFRRLVAQAVSVLLPPTNAPKELQISDWNMKRRYIYICILFQQSNNSHMRAVTSHYVDNTHKHTHCFILLCIFVLLYSGDLHCVVSHLCVAVPLLFLFLLWCHKVLFRIHNTMPLTTKTIALARTLKHKWMIEIRRKFWI